MCWWYFSTVGGVERNFAAKVNDTDGAVDADWNPNCSSSVRTMFKDGSSVYLGGNFTEVFGVSINFAAKVNDTDGAVDTTWNPNCSSIVLTMFPFIFILPFIGRGTSRNWKDASGDVDVSNYTSTQVGFIRPDGRWEKFDSGDSTKVGKYFNRDIEGEEIIYKLED